MKRMFLAILGIAWGLFVTWASIYAANHIDWPEVKSHATGCNDLEHCAPHARFVVELLASLLRVRCAERRGLSTMVGS